VSNQKFMADVKSLENIWQDKYGSSPDLGWGPRLRRWFGHYNPDDHYEALVDQLVQQGCNWAEVGCGRDIFPSNPALARRLIARCSHVLGIDPDENIKDNPFLNEWHQGFVEDYKSERGFDLVTLRMVAEHIEKPGPTATSLERMLKPGGIVVIYTPYKWAPVPIITRLTPFSLHQPVKRFIWNTEERDTFPVAFRLNTRADIRRHLTAAGLGELNFQLLDDCRSTSKFMPLNLIELSLWKVLSLAGLRYPECCVMAVYQKPMKQTPESATG
jgi:SAM-dependent methyltransferase